MKRLIIGSIILGCIVIITTDSVSSFVATSISNEIAFTLTTATSQSQPTPDEQYQTAQQYLTVPWTVGQKNATRPKYIQYRKEVKNKKNYYYIKSHNGNTIPAIPGSRVYGACAWRPGTKLVGEAYCWGGDDTPNKFKEKLQLGYGAGANQWHDSTPTTPKPYPVWPQPRTWATGIDCSGFVSHLWQIPKQGTSTLKKYAFEIKPESFTTNPSLKPARGDVWNSEKDGHVVWINEHIKEKAKFDTTIGKMVYTSEDDIYQAAGWNAKPKNQVQHNNNKGKDTWKFNSDGQYKNYHKNYRLLRLDIEKPDISFNGPQYATANATNHTVEWIGDLQISDNASYEVKVIFRVLEGARQIFKKEVKIALEKINEVWLPVRNQDLGAIKVDNSRKIKVYWHGEGIRNDLYGEGEYHAEVSIADLVGMKNKGKRAPEQGPVVLNRNFFVNRLGSITGKVTSQDKGKLDQLQITDSLKTIPIAGWTFTPSTQTNSSFEFLNLGAGTYKLTFTAQDHPKTVQEIKVAPWQNVKLDVVLIPPRPSILILAKQYGKEHTLVNAYSVPVTITGPVTRIQNTGIWGNGGKALFENILRGTYTVTAIVKAQKYYSSINQYRRYDYKVTATVTVSGNQTYTVQLPNPPST